jgi:Family of unknown function (DUF5681)
MFEASQWSGTIQALGCIVVQNWNVELPYGGSPAYDSLSGLNRGQGLFPVAFSSQRFSRSVPSALLRLEVVMIQRDSKGRFPRGGPSPNPGGRRREEIDFLRVAIHRKPQAEALVSNALVARLNEVVPNDPKERTYAMAIAESLIRRAISGDVQAAREITLRVEGPVVPESGNPSAQTEEADDVYQRLAKLIHQVRKNKPRPSLDDPQATKQ